MTQTRFLLRIVPHILIPALLLSCSSSGTPQTRYYLLTNPFGVTDDAAPVCELRVASVEVAPYLQSNNIMLQTSSNEMVPALQHRWSEPLHSGVLRHLNQCLQTDSSMDGGALRVSIEHLHGSEQGEVVLQGAWHVQAESGTAQQRFDLRQRQRGDGYDALVATHAELLTRLCQQIRSARSC